MSLHTRLAMRKEGNVTETHTTVGSVCVGVCVDDSFFMFAYVILMCTMDFRCVGAWNRDVTSRW